MPEVWDVRSTSCREPGLERRRGSAHRIRVVAVNGSISSLLLSWSGLWRRRFRAKSMEAPYVPLTSLEVPAVGSILWHNDWDMLPVKDSDALLFKPLATSEDTV